MIDTRELKSKALSAPNQVKILILSLPDKIEGKELVAKFDVILKIMEEEWNEQKRVS
ncbi:MAG: hypothetical protein QXU98_14405 [Candidatus Parvarchaeota archaeon]